MTYPTGVANNPDSLVFIDGADRTTAAKKSETSFRVPLKDDIDSSTLQLLVPAGTDGEYDNLVYFAQKSGDGFAVQEQTGLKNLMDYVGTAIRTNATLGQGLRVKSSLSLNVRNNESDAYTILEYGTLAKRHDNPNALKYISGSSDSEARIGKGVAFDGTDERVFSYGTTTLEFTSVLINLSSENYTTDYDFRAYCVIECEGETYVVYGDIVTKNILNIAQQVKNDTAYFDSLTGDEQAYINQITGN